MLKAVPRVVRLAVACLIASGCASSAVRFPNATPATPKEVPAELYTPSGIGPFPAVVLLHGCHGVSASTRQWARWFKERGYVALVVDSWAARGIKEDCSPTSPDLPNTERFDDGVGALRFLQARGDVDRDHVGVIGWSNGGAFAMALVNGPSQERARQRGVVMPEPGYRAAVGFYPGGCSSLIGQLAVRPLLVLIGASDDWTAAGPCVQMAESMRQRGADVSVVLYPGAFHYFDVEGQARTFLSDVVKDDRTGALGATVAYDSSADADAHRRVSEFFGYHLRRQLSMTPARVEPRVASDGRAEQRLSMTPARVEPRVASDGRAEQRLSMTPARVEPRVASDGRAEQRLSMTPARIEPRVASDGHAEQRLSMAPARIEPRVASDEYAGQRLSMAPARIESRAASDGRAEQR